MTSLFGGSCEGLPPALRIGAVEPCENVIDGDSGPVLDLGLLICELGAVESLFSQDAREDTEVFLSSVGSPSNVGMSDALRLLVKICEVKLAPVLRLRAGLRVSEGGMSGLNIGKGSESIAYELLSTALVAGRVIGDELVTSGSYLSSLLSSALVFFVWSACANTSPSPPAPTTLAVATCEN